MNQPVKKIGRPFKEYKAIRTTVKLPERLKKEMEEAMLIDNYGPHERSLWVEEAIINLLHNPTFYDLVVIDLDLKPPFVADGFRFTPHTKDVIDEAVITVRKKHPQMGAVTSAIVRTAVIQRLLRD